MEELDQGDVSNLEERSAQSPVPSLDVTISELGGSVSGHSHAKKPTGMDLLKSKATGVTDHVKQKLKSVLPERPRIRQRSKSRSRSRHQSGASRHDLATDGGSELMDDSESTGQERRAITPVHYDNDSGVDECHLEAFTPTTKRKYMRHRRQIDQIQIPNPLSGLLGQVEDFKNRLTVRRSQTPIRRKTTRGKHSRGGSAASSRCSSVEPEGSYEGNSEKGDRDEEDKHDLVSAPAPVPVQNLKTEERPSRPTRKPSLKANDPQPQSVTSSVQPGSIQKEDGIRHFDRMQQYDLEDDILGQIGSGPVVCATTVFPTAPVRNNEAIVGRLTMEPVERTPSPTKSKTSSLPKSYSEPSHVESRIQPGFPPPPPPSTFFDTNGFNGVVSPPQTEEEINISGAVAKLGRALLRFSSRSLSRLADYIEASSSEYPEVTEEVLYRERRASKQIILGILLVLLVGLILICTRSKSPEIVRTWELVAHPPA